MDDQPFLFGAAGVVDDADARVALRLLALNLQSPSLDRVKKQLEWLYETKRNVLVLTEVKAEGAAYGHLVNDLEASGFTVTRPKVTHQDRYATLVASKGFTARPAPPLAFTSPRLTAARLTTHFGELDVIGLYAPTNGLSVESSAARRPIQQALADALRTRVADTPEIPVLVAGDLNVLEPGHVPPCDLFADHDYDFYRSFGTAGLVDAYRHAQPDGRDVSWLGPKGGQRLDHAFLTARYIGRLAECRFDHTTRSLGLSDHSALTVTAV